MQRIDKIVRAPGLIRPAKTYSFFVDKDALTIVVVGPGSMRVGAIPAFGLISGAVTGAIKKPIENKVNELYAPKIEAGEKAVTEEKLSELVKQKHNARIPYRDMSLVSVSEHFQGAMLTFAAGKEKYKFFFRDKTASEVRELVKGWGVAVA